MMKKFLIILFLIVVTGCSNSKIDKNVEKKYSIKYNDEYYKIYMPYKKSVASNYVLNNNVVDFDIDKIEENLIQISTNVFDVKKYYYQEGQYLTKNHLKRLLSKESLNKTNINKIDNKKISPEIVASIVEKNFLDDKGNIKGVSIGIVLNPYQAYDSDNNYVTISQDDVIDHGKDISIDLISYMRDEFKLKDIPILIALYIESSPNSNIGGNYLYYGVTSNDKITFKYIEQKNYYMNNQNIKNIDADNYNNYVKFEESIKDYDSTIFMSGLGYYSGGRLSKIEITVTKSHYSYGELLYINQLLSNNSIDYFNNVKVVIKVNAINDIKSYIVKEPLETTAEIFIY